MLNFPERETKVFNTVFFTKAGVCHSKLFNDCKF